MLSKKIVCRMYPTQAQSELLEIIQGKLIDREEWALTDKEGSVSSIMIKDTNIKVRGQHPHLGYIRRKCQVVKVGEGYECRLFISIPSVFREEPKPAFVGEVSWMPQDTSKL
jgi:hypothetical protein